MKSLLTFFLFFCIQLPVNAESGFCGKGPVWFQHACNHLYRVWTEGDNELYLTGYAWHNRYTYSPEKIKSFNENAWGGGFGRSLYDKKGNLHSLYMIAFMDSHNHLEPLVGYAYLKYFPLNSNTKIGIGLSAFLTSRADIYHNIPFLGALPAMILTHKQFSLSASYIPGAQGAGNVLFIIGKYTFKNF